MAMLNYQMVFVFLRPFWMFQFPGAFPWTWQNYKTGMFHQFSVQLPVFASFESPLKIIHALVWKYGTPKSYVFMVFKFKPTIRSSLWLDVFLWQLVKNSLFFQPLNPQHSSTPILNKSTKKHSHQAFFHPKNSSWQTSHYLNPHENPPCSFHLFVPPVFF